MKGNIIGIIGYNEDVRYYAAQWKSRGKRVVIGLRDFWGLTDEAETEGFEVTTPEDLAAMADLIQIW